MPLTIAVCGVLCLAGPAAGAAAVPPAAHPENALIDGAPLITKWAPPSYPPEALNAKIGGRVVVRIIVDETGHVTSARPLMTPDPRLGEAAVAAVKTWEFSPAIENRKPVAMCIDVPQIFDASKGDKGWKPGQLPDGGVVAGIKPAPRTAAAVKSAPLGDYPATLSSRRLAGVVTFVCTVAADGRASAPRILNATHADFVPPALASFAKWEFQPGMQGDLPVGGEMRGEITFDPVAVNHAELLAANALTAPDGSPPADTPLPQTVVDPVWPHDLLLKGEGGSASVEFTVQPDGRVAGLKVREATQPDFGRALAAAMEEWIFQPAMRNGEGVAVPLMHRVQFKAVSAGGEAEPDDPLARLVRLAQADGIHGGAGLDEKLAPLYRVTPVYPAALRAGERPAGQAVIEFVIDRDGRVRLPRIVSATHGEFGWAAATAMGQWVFKTPLRGGQPTEVKAQIPFQFSAPVD